MRYGEKINWEVVVEAGLEGNLLGNVDLVGTGGVGLFSEVLAINDLCSASL